MQQNKKQRQRIAAMTFASGYPSYLQKVTKKGRTEAELREVIRWLAGYDERRLQTAIFDKLTFEAFFQQARLHPKGHLITGLICGYRIEEIGDPLIR